MLKNRKNWYSLSIERAKNAAKAVYNQSGDGYVKFLDGPEPSKELADTVGNLHDSVMRQKKGTALEIAAQVAVKKGDKNSCA